MLLIHRNKFFFYKNGTGINGIFTDFANEEFREKCSYTRKLFCQLITNCQADEIIIPGDPLLILSVISGSLLEFSANHVASPSPIAIPFEKYILGGLLIGDKSIL